MSMIVWPNDPILPPHDPRATIVTDPAELPKWHALLKDRGRRRWIAADTETSGFDYFKDAEAIGFPFGYDLGDGVTRGVYFPIRHQTADRQLPVDWTLWMVRDLLQDPELTVVGHNVKFDMHFWQRDGIETRCQIHDTMLMVALIDENRSKEMESCALDFGLDDRAYEMKAIVSRLLAEECKRRGIRKRDAPGYSWIPVPVLGRYGCKDGYNTLALGEKLLPIVQRHWGQLYETERKLLRYLQRAEYIGTPIDLDYLRGVHVNAERKAEQLRAEINRLAGAALNVASDAEMRHFLFEHLKFEPTHYTKNGRPDPYGETEDDRWGTPAVDERAIKALIRKNRPGTIDLLRTILDWRAQDKILTTYTTPIIEKCDARNYLHTSLNQVRANTGRMSSSGPNLQNIPTPGEDGDEDAQLINIRRAFLVPPGRARIYIDFSQVELRVLAYYSKDPTMVAAFVNGEDIHTRTSLELFNSKEKKWRRVAKVINFGLSYGMSPMGVMENLNATADPSKGIEYVTEQQSEEYLARFHTRYPRVMGFCRELWTEMRKHTLPQFTNLFGRTRRIADLASFEKWRRSRAERQAVASMIQGTAADIAKVSMVRVGERLDEARAAGRYEGSFVLTVHDENQMDVDIAHVEEAARELQRDMQYFPQFAPIDITAEVEVSTTNWSDKKPLGGKK